MAFDAFIKIDGIEGESTDKKRTWWIEVLSCEAKDSQMVSDTAHAPLYYFFFPFFKITTVLDGRVMD